MSKAKRCDWCSKISNENEKNNHMDNYREVGFPLATYDICESCYIAFRTFVESRRKAEK